MSRVYNFSAGPAALPLEVLQEAQKEMIDFKGCGMSVMEMSHRGKDYDAIHHFATQALNLVPENVKAQNWLVYAIYHSRAVVLAKREIEKAKTRLTSEEFDTLQKFICKDESLPYGQLFD